LSILTRMLGFLFAIDGIILLPFQHGWWVWRSLHESGLCQCVFH
jgi:hypothetical protein